MFFKTASRVNPQANRLSIYYRLVENYRNPLGEPRQRNIMSVGFMEDISPGELHQIAEGIRKKIKGQQVVLKEYGPLVSHYINNLYTRLVGEKRIDRLEECHPEKGEGDWQQIDLNSVNNENVREAGAEWMCLQTIDKSGIGSYLEEHGWSKEDRDLAPAHIACRAVYPASELKTVRLMQDNSSVCELPGLDPKQITKDKLYRISHKLYKEKEGLESHPGHKTNELFDLQDRIILYDLTNTCFEGGMRNSAKAKRGRGKEKRSDCPLLVLALAVNVEGLIKYSTIHEGNKSEPATPGDMTDKLGLATGDLSHKAIVVMDAGIATEENLQSVTSKGYDCVCASRSGLRKYKIAEGAVVEKVKDRKERETELLHVRTEDSTDSEYYLKVSSPGKALKGKSMSEHFHKRLEEDMENIANGISQKHETGKYDRVNRRIGRLKERYPSIHRMYSISLEKTEKGICTSLRRVRLPQTSAV